MRINIITQIELDPTEILTQARMGQPDMPEEMVPAMVCSAIHTLVEQAIPGLQAHGHVVIPELKTSEILRPTGRLII